MIIRKQEKFLLIGYLIKSFCGLFFTAIQYICVNNIKRKYIKRPLRILFLSQSGHWGGAQNSLKILLDGLERKKYEPCVVCSSQGGFSDYLLEQNIQCKIIPLLRTTSRKFDLKEILFHLHAFLRIVVYCFQCKIQLIYTNTVFPVYGIFLRRLFHIPHIWHVRESLSNPKYQFILNPLTIKKIIESESDKIIVNSEYVKKSSNLINAKVIYNAIEKYVNVFMKTDMIFQGTINVGNVGLFARQKNQKLLIEAIPLIVKKFNNIAFHFYGKQAQNEQIYYQQLIQLADQLHMKDHIYFHGFIPKENIYQNIDILVHAGLHEGFGRVLIEAMSYGIPVVAVNSGAIPEIVDNKSGILVENNEQSVAEGVLRLLQRRELYHEFSKRGYERVKKQFTSQQYIDEITKVYDSIYQ